MNTKVEMDINLFALPMPMAIIGAELEGKANFMSVAWINRVNMNPPLLMTAIGKHKTARGILENQSFSVNIPSIDLAKETDYIGMVSGDQVDKSTLFPLFYGQLKSAPLIKSCPFNAECKLYKTVKLPNTTLFIGEIIKAYADEKYLKEADLSKANPLIYSMFDKVYRSIGAPVAKAWSIGKDFKN